jgi:ubiquinone/menaquinone biosynthesis C-methylase UbiE
LNLAPARLGAPIIPGVDHADHVNLLRNGVAEPGGVWADFGAGSGAFTLALAQLLGPDGEIHAIDRDAEALHANERAMCSRFPSGQPAATVRYRVADFTIRLDLPLLDGIVTANALHFQRYADAVVGLFRSYLRDGGRLLVVEYNTTGKSFAVSYPVPYPRLQELARQAGFGHTELLARRHDGDPGPARRCEGPTRACRLAR